MADSAPAKTEVKTTISAPDQAEYEAQKAELEKTLAELGTKLEELQTEIDSKEEKSQDIGEARNEMVKKLRACQLKKNELHSSTSTSRMRKQEIDRERMELRSKIQTTRANLRFTNLKALDKKIKDLEGNKAMLGELNVLKAQRNKTANLEKFRKEEAKLEKEAETLGNTINAKGREAQKLRKEESRLMDKVTALEKNADNRGARSLANALRKTQDKKNKITRQISNLTKNFEKAKKAFEKAEKKRLRKEARELNPVVKAQPEKVEEQPQPVRQRDPYAEHKKAVVALTKYLSNLLPPEHKAEQEKKSPEARTELNTNFGGKTALKKLSRNKDKDEDFFYGANRKKGKKRRQKKQKKQPLRILNHPRIPRQQFAKIEVTAPLYASQVLETLKAIAAKGQFYETAPPPSADAKTSKPSAKPAKKETEKEKHQHELEDFQKESEQLRSAKLGNASAAATGPMMTAAELESDYRTYDNDKCMGKAAPSLADIEYITDKAKYVPAKAGEVTLVMFWGQFSKAGFRFNPLYSEINDEFKDLKVVFLSVDKEIGHAKKFLEDPKKKYAKVFRTDFAVAYDAKRAVHAQFSALLQKSIVCCHAFLISAAGKIVWHQDHSQIGATAPTFLNAMKTAISATLADQAVPSVGAKEGAGGDDSDEESDEECAMMGV